MKHITKSEKQTFNLGKKIAQSLKGGEVLTLSGNLGAGKTIFTKGLADGLGVKKIVTSPTFILMNVYQTRIKNPTYAKASVGRQEARVKKLVHIDCYRIASAQEIVDIGAVEYLNDPNAITVIEWPEKIKKILPKDRTDISIKLKKDNSREIIVTDSRIKD